MSRERSSKVGDTRCFNIILPVCFAFARGFSCAWTPVSHLFMRSRACLPTCGRCHHGGGGVVHCTARQRRGFCKCCRRARDRRLGRSGSAPATAPRGQCVVWWGRVPGCQESGVGGGGGGGLDVRRGGWRGEGGVPGFQESGSLRMSWAWICRQNRFLGCCECVCELACVVGVAPPSLHLIDILFYFRRARSLIAWSIHPTMRAATRRAHRRRPTPTVSRRVRCVGGVFGLFAFWLLRRHQKGW